LATPLAVHANFGGSTSTITARSRQPRLRNFHATFRGVSYNLELDVTLSRHAYAKARLSRITALCCIIMWSVYAYKAATTHNQL